MHAKLRFSYGTMGSGKSLDLLTAAYNFEQKNIPFAIIKSSIDTRDGGEIKSRIGDGVSRKCMLVDQETNLYELFKEIKNFNNGENAIQWLFVDEAQFLTEEQVDQLSDVVDYLGINVMCYGLRTDFKSRLFPGSKRLFELADTIEEIKSTCECGSKTIINARVDKDGNVLKNGPQTLVGGDDRYISICRKCWKRSI